MSGGSVKSWNPAAAQIGLRRRRRLIITFDILLILLTGSIVFRHSRLPATGWDDWAAFNGQTVQFISVDGPCEISVRSPGSAITRVYLLGIVSVDEPWDSQAKNYLATHLTGKSLLLRLEPIQPRDPQGRLLAYAYLDDLDMVNVDLVRAGLAKTDRWRKSAFHGEISAAEAEARRKRAGLWQ
jgi:Staphylococcal nuclease homologue